MTGAALGLQRRTQGRRAGRVYTRSICGRLRKHMEALLPARVPRRAVLPGALLWRQEKGWMWGLGLLPCGLQALAQHLRSHPEPWPWGMTRSGPAPCSAALRDPSAARRRLSGPAKSCRPAQLWTCCLQKSQNCPVACSLLPQLRLAVRRCPEAEQLSRRRMAARWLQSALRSCGSRRPATGPAAQPRRRPAALLAKQACGTGMPRAARSTAASLRLAAPVAQARPAAALVTAIAAAAATAATSPKRLTREPCIGQRATRRSSTTPLRTPRSRGAACAGSGRPSQRAALAQTLAQPLTPAAQRTPLARRPAASAYARPTARCL